MTNQRPLPIIDDDNRRFWESCKEHAMELQRCRDCTSFRYYPTPVCDRCTSFAFDWRPVSGRGTVYTFAVVHRAPSEAFLADVPYVYAVVELAEGPMMTTNVVGITPDDVRIGMPVEVVYADVTPEITLARFAPTGD